MGANVTENITVVNLSETKGNNVILSAIYYTEKAKGRTPYSLVKGRLKAWDSSKSLPADAMYLNGYEYDSICQKLKAIKLNMESLEHFGIKVDVKKKYL